MSRLSDLSEQFGQSPWLDNLKRSYLTSGELATMRDRGVRGLTSTPPTLEELFVHHYGDVAATGSAHATRSAGAATAPAGEER